MTRLGRTSTSASWRCCRREGSRGADGGARPRAGERRRHGRVRPRQDPEAYDAGGCPRTRSGVPMRRESPSPWCYSAAATRLAASTSSSSDALRQDVLPPRTSRRGGGLRARRCRGGCRRPAGAASSSHPTRPRPTSRPYRCSRAVRRGRRGAAARGFGVARARGRRAVRNTEECSRSLLSRVAARAPSNLCAAGVSPSVRSNANGAGRTGCDPDQ
jgi:hypothetical protein